MSTLTKSAAGIGSPTPRIEGREKVTGAARYAAEQHVERLHHAVIIPATIAAGRVIQIETVNALALAGVIGVLDYTNTPRLKALKIFPLGPAGESRLPLQDDRVDYAGQAIALVVAQSPEVAAHAANSFASRTRRKRRG